MGLHRLMVDAIFSVHFSSTFAASWLFLSSQVRLLDGSTITTVFKAQEPLAAVRVYVQMNGNTPEGQDFTLISPYPRHVYTELDMEKPLKELGELGIKFSCRVTGFGVIVKFKKKNAQTEIRPILSLCVQVWCLQLCWLLPKSKNRRICSVSLPHHFHYIDTRDAENGLIPKQSCHLLVPPNKPDKLNKSTDV